LVSAGTVKRNSGGFTVGSGIFTVPTGSGYSEVQLFAQIRTTNLGNADRIYAGFRRHGVVEAITDTAGAKYAAVSATMRGLSSAGQQELQVFSPRIPVSGGDVFSLWVETNAVAAVISGSSAALAEDEGTSIWFSIEAFTTSGSSSAAAGAEYGAHIRAVSGAGTTQTLTTAISTVISGMTTTVRNVGGFTITHSGITVPTGSGYTHVELQGQITYTSNATGLRQMQFFQAGQTQLGIPGNPHGVVTQQQQAVVQASALTIVGGLSPRFPVSGGELFQLVGRQDSGGDLTVVHGFGTWFSLKAFKLTSGG
jgi:hypothetical protein